MQLISHPVSSKYVGTVGLQYQPSNWQNEKQGRNNFDVLGELPTSSTSETNQFRRILKLIEQAAAELEFCIAVIHCNYCQKGMDAIYNANIWKGEFDIVILAPDRIFIYELKSGNISVRYGRTDNKPWIIDRNGNIHKESSWFKQASRQRYYLLQTFLNEQKSILDIPEPNHFVVDSRIILPDMTGCIKFYQKAPLEITGPDMEVLATRISNLDFEFIRGIYSEPRKEPDCHVRTGSICRNQSDRIKEILKSADIGLKAERWFQVLKEHELIKDFRNTHTDKFKLSKPIAREIAQALQSHKDRLYNL